MTFTTRPELMGTFGMVSTTHWLASQAGMKNAGGRGNGRRCRRGGGLRAQRGGAASERPAGRGAGPRASGRCRYAARALRSGCGARGRDTGPLPGRRARDHPRLRTSGDGDAWGLRRVDADATRSWAAVAVRGAGPGDPLCRTRTPDAGGRRCRHRRPAGRVPAGMAHIRTGLACRATAPPRPARFFRKPRLRGDVATSRRGGRGGGPRPRSADRGRARWPMPGASWPRP